MTTSKYCVATIRFLREKSDSAKDSDDTIRIQPALDGFQLPTGKFRVRYQLPKSIMNEGVGIQQVRVMMPTALQAWLNNLFRLLTLDSDPFRSYQLDLPCYPSVLISHAKLEKALPILEEVFCILADPDTDWATYTESAATVPIPAAPMDEADSEVSDHYNVTEAIWRDEEAAADDGEAHEVLDSCLQRIKQRQSLISPIRTHLYFDEDGTTERIVSRCGC